jgi:flagellar protein FlaD
MERLDSVERAIDEAIRRMDMSERSSESFTHDINTVKESIGRIDANMRELTSLYDLISSQVNPFIDVEQGEIGEEGTVGQTPSFDTLFEPTPEVSAEGGGPSALADNDLQMMGEAGVPPSQVYAQPGAMVPGEPTAGMYHQGVAIERPLRVARLTQIGSDSTCLMALVRWIEYLLSRVRRSEIKSVLSFYVRIGWISDGIRNHMLDIIRGIKSSPTGSKISTTTIEAPKDKEGDVVMSYGKERVHEMKAMDSKRPMQDDWRLTIEDHLKSLIFIERIRGTEVNKDKLEDLERDVENLRKGLDGFFGL